MAVVSLAERSPLLVLFDGHGIIFRAYFALPPLTHSKTGESVNAVHGFASMYLKAIQDLRPSHVAVAFDAPGRTFRDDQYDLYKATRQETPNDLVSQVGRVHDLVEALSVTSYEVPSFEADDVLGTLAQQAAGLGIPVVIVTGDTDILQLVDDNTRVLANRGMFSDTVLYDLERVRERYGLEPSQLSDYRGLKGDSSDNIPGVPSVGEKTATKLLQEFGSVDAIYERIDAVTPPKLQAKLIEFEAQARLSTSLATIVRDAPVQLDLEMTAVTRFDRGRALDFFRVMEFRTLANRLPGESADNRTGSGQMSLFAPAEAADGEATGDGPVIAISQTPHQYHTVASDADLPGLAIRLRQGKQLSVGVAASGNDPMTARLAGLALAVEAGEAWYLPVGHAAGPNLDLAAVRGTIGPLLADPALPKLTHNANTDLTLLAQHGLPVDGLRGDTMLAAYLLNEKALGVKDLALLKLGLELVTQQSITGIGSKAITLAQAPIDSVAAFACANVDAALRLDASLAPQLVRQECAALLRDVELPLVPVLVAMERSGITIDRDLLAGMSAEMAVRIAGLEQQIYEAAGRQFNINSTQQLGDILYKELKVTDRPPRTKTGFSTDAAVLEGLADAHPIVQHVLDYRQVLKLKSTYVDALPLLADPATGRVHSRFNQTVAATGRLSSSDPNLQNIPVRTEEGRRIRKAFVARGPGGEPWTLVAADYSQIELRIAAHFAQDDALLRAFRDDQDIHRATMALVLNKDPRDITSDERRIAKAINFGLIYGQGAFGLAQVTGMERAAAAAFIEAYFAEYAGVRRYVDETKALAYQQGYVSTILGRRRYLPDIHSANRMIRSAAERMAINMPVQGTAADIIKLAMIRLHDRLHTEGMAARMLLQVHDELIFEAPLAEVPALRDLILDIMPHAVELDVPLRVDVKAGVSWGDME